MACAICLLPGVYDALPAARCIWCSACCLVYMMLCLLPGVYDVLPAAWCILYMILWCCWVYIILSVLQGVYDALPAARCIWYNLPAAWCIWCSACCRVYMMFCLLPGVYDNQQTTMKTKKNAKIFTSNQHDLLSLLLTKKFVSYNYERVHC